MVQRWFGMEFRQLLSRHRNGRWGFSRNAQHCGWTFFALLAERIKLRKTDATISSMTEFINDNTIMKKGTLERVLFSFMCSYFDAAIEQHV
jgi:hypothetical protein